MVFRIVSELPGRLRLRCGAGLFTDGEARGVSYELMAIEGVRTAEVHASNGSILVTFEFAARETVLACVRALDPLALPQAEVGLATRHTTRFATATWKRLFSRLISSAPSRVPRPTSA